MRTGCLETHTSSSLLAMATAESRAQRSVDILFSSTFISPPNTWWKTVQVSSQENEMETLTTFEMKMKNNVLSNQTLKLISTNECYYSLSNLTAHLHCQSKISNSP